METQEIWKTIEEFENYQVSSLGRVKSLKYKRSSNSKVLKEGVGRDGYPVVVLCNDIKKKTFKVHKLVATAFLNHTPCGMTLVVNHKNFIRTDNRVDNLEIVTSRENTNLKHIPSSSKYVGVSWSKHCNKWKASIRIRGKSKHLGLFFTEIDASNAYQKKLKEINNANS